MTDLGKRAGRRLRELREARGIQQTDLIEPLGVSQSFLSRIENEKAPASYALVERAAEYFGVSPAYFYSDEVEPVVVGRKTIHTDASGRATSCPECGDNRYDEQARYCLMCGHPLYNFCIGEERHVNKPEARYCGTCGRRTFWSLTAEERESLEVPDDVRSSRKTEAPVGKR